MKKVGSKKGASAEDADKKGGKEMEHPAPKLPPLPTFKQVSVVDTPAVNKKTTPRKKALRVERRGASARRDSSAKPRRSPVSGLKSPVSSSPVTAAEQLTAQVAALQEQLFALREQLATSHQPLHHAVIAQRVGGPLSDAHRAPLQPPPVSTSSYQVSGFESQVSSSSPATHPPLHHAVVAQREGGQPFSTGNPSATAAKPPAAQPLVYELKQTQPVGFESSKSFDSASESSANSFFSGALDRARVQWLMGDWEGLGLLDPARICASPDREKLLLLAGCGALQAGNIQNFKRILSHAKTTPILADLRKALLSSTFSVLAKAAQLRGSRAKALRFEQHAVSEMERIGFLEGLRLPGRTRDGLGELNRKALENLETLERKNKFAELEIESLRSQVDTLKSRSFTPPAAPVPAAQAPTPAVPSPPVEKKYYGLDGLDRKLEVFLDFDNGYFVELGANDGINQSNTCYFEKSRGWKGVLIEPVLHNFIKCKSNRSPENIFQCAACVGFDYQKDTLRLYYSNLMTTPTGVQSDCPDPEAQARGGYQYIPAHEQNIEIHAPAKTLQSILVEAGAPRVIDLLSLDVEGGEIEVLKGIDHAHFTFRYLLVECRRIDQMQEFLKPLGYSLVEKLSFHDYLFQSNALNNSKTKLPHDLA